MFEIAHKDLLKLINIKGNQTFLLTQREKSRREAMIGVDTILAAQKKKKRIENRKVKENTRQRKNLARCILKLANISEYLFTSFIDIDGNLKTFNNMKNILW